MTKTKISRLRSEDHFIYNDFPLVIAVRDPQPEFEKHSHQFTELLIITKGKAIHVIDEKEYSVSAGDVFVIKKNKEHEFKNIENLSLINIIFIPDRLNMDKWFIEDLPGFRAIFQLEPEYRDNHRFESRLEIGKAELAFALNIIDALKLELENSPTGFKAASISLFIKLLVYLSRCYEKSLKPQSITLLRIARAINYLDRNFTADIDFYGLAGIAHMSLRNFQRVFKKSMGCTARDYLMDLRIDFSRTMLKQGRNSITDIAYASGFKDSNYFTRQFKNKMGISPSEYRKILFE
jgi:AraC-like DNA-binding protein/mannose-6-phosphate isomerase-like protein (cupin superfamily)